VRQLADLGAEVIRVAHPRRGDLGGSDAHNLHRNKRSLLLDLKTEPGREAFLRLVDRADVLVENFRSDVKRRLRIDYAVLAERNPRLVYASISGFGQDGPYATRAGVDQIAQGLGGLMSVTGPPGGGPWRAGIAISDTAAGTFLTQGVLAALLARERSGRGQWVHTSLLEAMINFMDFQAVRWLTDGVVPPQSGNDHPTDGSTSHLPWTGKASRVRSKRASSSRIPASPTSARATAIAKRCATRWRRSWRRARCRSGSRS
jgi:crotonobetainyl-CoA:carnitine CoA-transferase CaiB-like acyl-CoA transferase